MALRGFLYMTKPPLFLPRCLKIAWSVKQLVAATNLQCPVCIAPSKRLIQQQWVGVVFLFAVCNVSTVDRAFFLRCLFFLQFVVLFSGSEWSRSCRCSKISHPSWSLQFIAHRKPMKTHHLFDALRTCWSRKCNKRPLSASNFASGRINFCKFSKIYCPQYRWL